MTSTHPRQPSLPARTRSSDVVARLGTILSLWAHPDDETYLAAGVMSIARRQGQRVVCVVATSGEHGTDDPTSWPPERLGRVRRWEADAAMAVLGIDEHHVLDFGDGTLAADDRRAIDQIGRWIDDVRPDTILTFGADGITFHPDHIAVHHWATAAWRERGATANLLYATNTREFLDEHAERFEDWGIYMTDDRPAGVASVDADLLLSLDATDLDRKLTALRAMATQTSGAYDLLGPELYALQAAQECFVAASRAATPHVGSVVAASAALTAGG